MNDRFSLTNIKSSCGSIGATAELVVATDLMKKGYEVYRALSPSSSCDLITIIKNKVIRIEVRTGRYYKGDKEIKLYYAKKNVHADCVVVVTFNDMQVHYIDLDL